MDGSGAGLGACPRPSVYNIEIQDANMDMQEQRSAVTMSWSFRKEYIRSTRAVQSDLMMTWFINMVKC